MRRNAQWLKVLILVLCTVLWLAADATPIFAGGKNSDRTESWEFTIPIRYIAGPSVDFGHGSSIDVHDDLAWGFGFGYNFNEKMNLGFEIDWMDADYRVTIASADGLNPDWKATGNLQASTTQVNFTYNFMAKTITPYLSGGIGWTWIDSNIPDGPPEGYCWWDPWYGNICTTYQDTKYVSGFSYGVGVGLRIEPKDNFFFRVGLNDNWQDFGSYSSNTDILSGRLEMGWKF